MKKRNAAPSADCSFSNEGIQVSQAWMVDLNGILMGLVTKRTEEILLEEFAGCLNRGELLAFHSDRTPVAIADAIVSPLEERISDRDVRERIIGIGENGGAWATYASDGQLQFAFDPTLSVPVQLAAAIEELVRDPAFEPLLFLERGRRTMLNISRHPGIPLPFFQQIQPQFARLAQQCLDHLGLAASWKIERVSNAIEIRHRSANKGKGAQRSMQWWRQHGLHPKEVIAIDESASGLAMAEVLSSIGVPVTFVFTGWQALPRTCAFPLIQTQRKCEQGMIEYFAQYRELSSVSIRG